MWVWADGSVRNGGLHVTAYDRPMARHRRMRAQARSRARASHGGRRPAALSWSHTDKNALHRENSAPPHQAGMLRCMDLSKLITGTMQTHSFTRTDLVTYQRVHTDRSRRRRLSDVGGNGDDNSHICVRD